MALPGAPTGQPGHGSSHAGCRNASQQECENKDAGGFNDGTFRILGLTCAVG